MSSVLQYKFKFFAQTISKFGKLDILISNAAVNPTFGPTLEVSNLIIDPAWYFLALKSPNKFM